MKQFFILGRNPELSRAEILGYLEGRSRPYKEILFEEGILILGLEKQVDIQKLGGVMQSGILLYDGNIKGFEGYLDSEDIPQSDKFSYSIHGNGNRDYLSEKFKREKRKAMFKPGTKTLHQQGGETIHYSETDYTFLLFEDAGSIYFGIVEQIFDSEQMAKRDMEKPVRREELAISPRLSRILINLTGVTSGKTIADPFCGIGAVLIEGLALGLHVYGRDIDKQAVREAKQNLTWYTNTYGSRGRYIVEAGNSRELPEQSFDGIAGEGPLGALLKGTVSKKEAREMLEDFERRIIPVLERIARCVKKGGNVSLTFPVIGGNHIDVKRVAEEAGLQITVGPIHEYREGQHVSRDIIVFQA